jgi:hypothetical protein
MQSNPGKTGGQKKETAQAGCLILAALPFALSGIWSAADAVRAVREGARAQAISAGIFALAFCAVGFGVITVSLYGTRQAARARALNASRSGDRTDDFEDEYEDWSAARIDSDQTQGVRGAWALALLWNFFFSPVYVAFLVESWRGSRPAPASLIVPIVGMGLIIRAALRGRGWGRSGASTFEIADGPVTIGGRLVGRIVSDRMPANGTSIRLRLTCVRHEGRRSGIERMIWETEKKVTAGDIRSTGGIPVDFDIPAHCEPTSADRSSTSHIKWVLQAEAAEPGVSFAPRFDVQVSQAGRSASIASEPGTD